MAGRFLRTSDLARATGVHPNTVRLYEQWGFIPPAERTASGYRVFTERHLALMRLARTALHGGWPGRPIRSSALELVGCAAGGELEETLRRARRHLELVKAERAEARRAADAVEAWARGSRKAADSGARLHIADAARAVGASVDMLRNWERNGLLRTPRDGASGYRTYGPVELERLRIIRMLLRAGYGMVAIGRMLRRLDAGARKGLKRALDTPQSEDVIYATDRWLTTLESQEKRAKELVRQARAILARAKGRPSIETKS